MDVATSAAIERLSERIDVLEATMHGGFTSLHGEIGTVATKLGTVEDTLREEIGSVRNDLEKKIDDLRAETGGGFVENRRHTEVLFESLRDDIRILAEGFASVSTKLDSLQR